MEGKLTHKKRGTSAAAQTHKIVREGLGHYTRRLESLTDHENRPDISRDRVGALIFACETCSGRLSCVVAHLPLSLFRSTHHT